MAESRCVICGGKKNGLEVRDDYVINAVRWFKRNITRNEKNYRLVVCKECFLRYKKARNSYQRKQIAYISIGVVFAAVLVFASSDKLLTMVYGIAIVIFMYLLSQLSYMPGVEIPAAKEKK